MLTSFIAKCLGVPEPSIRLFLNILLGYPIGYIYHIKNSNHASRQQRNTYIVLTGLGLSFFFNSLDMIHSFITATVTYAILFCLKGGRLSTTLVWIFNFTYLMLGYHHVASYGYDINWTTAQCVLCFRLMGFSMDLMDGQTKQASTVLTGPHSFASDTPLKQLPGFFEYLGYCYFPTAFLIGPQFSFSLYSRFLNGGTTHNKTRYLIRCVLLGVMYIVVLQTLGAKYPTSYLLTEDYLQKPWIKRCIIYWLSGKLVFTKYFGVWLLTEGRLYTFSKERSIELMIYILGACTLFGINYYHKKEGHITTFDYSGLANCKPLQFELMTSIDHFVLAFNINTNLWVKQYVFKRLLFLGNKQLSQLGTFLFLAIWHGTHFNYFDTFALEFAYMFVEKNILRPVLYEPIIKPKIQQQMWVYYAWKCIAWLTATTAINYAMVGFDLLTFSRGVVARNSVYWYVHFIVLVVLVICYTQKKSRKLDSNKLS